MPLVDYVKEHVRRIGAVREIPHLVDHQDGWMRVGLQSLRELAVAKGGGQITSDSEVKRRVRTASAIAPADQLKTSPVE
jgi:hypothetical protein